MALPSSSQGAAVAARGWLPREAPLLMPSQDFSEAPARGTDRAATEADYWQIAQFVLAGAMTAFAAWCASNALLANAPDLLDLLDLGLFTVLFGWIAYALANALIGFGVSLEDTASARPAAPSGASLRGRTAILMPVHNEEPELVCARLRNMDRSLRSLAVETSFDIFILSDTRDPDILLKERAAAAGLRSEEGQERRIFYRWRAENVGRKAGNIADWVRTFGGAYAYMVVLDADSVMDGATLVRLHQMMDEEPRTALIQTAPQLVNRLSLFGRLQQFSSRLYGPMLTVGLAEVCGGSGNYWGHNAILRVKAFADHAGLPRMNGFGPWSGEILSHDFVEAALLRRAGWAVRLAPELTGSFEECPPSLSDLIVRDRRWCQGNLQHLPLIFARGLHWVSRVHLARGVLTYLMPPLWLLFLVVGAARAALATRGGGAPLDDYALDTVTWLLSMSLVSLLLPRVLSLVRTLVLPRERQAWSSPLALVAGVVLEVCLSALISPILLTAQSIALVGILLGRRSGWAAQTRRDGALSWRDAARRYAPHTVAGLVMGAASLRLGAAASLWMAPVVLGLLSAVPTAVLSSDPVLGARLRALGLFVTPEERAPPAVLEGLAPVAATSGRPELRRILEAFFAEGSPVVEADRAAV